MEDDNKKNDFSKALESLTNAFETVRQMSVAITDASEKIDQIFEVVYSQQTKEMIVGISNAMQTFTDIVGKIKVPEIKIPNEFINALHKLSIIMTLRKAEWPFFFYIDEKCICRDRN